MNLFLNYFEHKDPERNEELKFCLKKNEENEHIKNIYIINRENRTSFGQFFQEMKKHPNEVNILANSDIYFDDSIKQAVSVQNMQCYALTRWEDFDGLVMPFNARHGRSVPMQWSQDAWVFRGAPDPSHFMTVNAVENRRRVHIPFYLGIPGCDNKLAAMLRSMRYQVINPCYSIRAIHKHDKSSRDYLNYMIVEGIKPNGLVYPQKLEQ